MCSLFCSPSVPPSLSLCECGAEGAACGCTACPVCPTVHNVSGSIRCRMSSPPQLPVSTPPTSLDECFYFISLVVGLLCGSIFCQFWLFFVFKLLSFFWLCEEVQWVYLRLHLGRNCVNSSLSTWYNLPVSHVVLGFSLLGGFLIATSISSLVVVCSDFLYLHNSIVVGFTILGFYQYFLSYIIC